MIDYNYYDNLRKASIVPEHIRKMFEDNSKTGKIYVEMYLPFIRVANYAATNEPKLFFDLLKKMKNAKKLPPYFHRRMLYKELYRSLGLLGDECLTCLLSELDCSDPVLNGLYDSVINHDPDAFEKVMQGWDGSFSQVTPICRLLSLELFFNDAFERIVKEENRIDKITDLNQQSQEIKAFGRKVIDVFNMKAKDIFNDAFDDGSDKRLEKTFDEYLDETLKFAIDTRELDEVGYDFNKKGFMLVSLVADPNVEIPEKAPKDFFYKALLIAYGYLVTETSISRSAKRVIEETLFVPEYEAIWKQYKDLGFIDYFKEEFKLKVKTQPTPQIEEPAGQESISTIGATTWCLPVDFFDKSYIDDCDINEYIPHFLEDKINIAAVVNEKLAELKLKLNVVFQDFIETLAGEGCIDNDYLTKASFAHALTGRKVDVEIKKVKWKYSQSTKDKGWLNNICFIASKLYPRYIYDKNHNQLKKFDQINKVFDLDYDSLTPEIYKKINPDKFGSSYGANADDFVKNAVEKFLNSVEFIKTSIGA